MIGSRRTQVAGILAACLTAATASAVSPGTAVVYSAPDEPLQALVPISGDPRDLVCRAGTPDEWKYFEADYLPGVRCEVVVSDGKLALLVTSEAALSVPADAVVALAWRGGREVRLLLIDPVNAVPAGSGPPPAVPLVPRDAEIVDVKSGRARAKVLARNPEERRPSPVTFSFFGKPLTVGGEYSVSSRIIDGEERESRLRQVAKGEAFYVLNPRSIAYAEARVVSIAKNEPGELDPDDRVELRRGETWLYFSELLNTRLSLQIGRQQFRDRREWWWDEELDAVRVHYDSPKLHLEVALARELFGRAWDRGIEAARDDITRVMGLGTWAWSGRHRLEAFYLSQRDRSPAQTLGERLPEADRDPFDADLDWLGLRARGKMRLSDHRLYYWIDAAMVEGTETSARYERIEPGVREVSGVSTASVRGNAYDVGVTWEAPSKMRLTASYAFGSGNDSDEGDGAFRQTGLHDNNGKYRGVDRFRYYGELLRPELSNLAIGTVALGWPLLEDSSIEIILHRYRQAIPSDEIRDTQLDIDPAGLSDDIGWEANIVVGLEEWRHLELELIAAGFRAGNAFALARDLDALGLFVKLDYNF